MTQTLHKFPCHTHTHTTHGTVPPTFIAYPVDKATNNSSTTFMCTVKGYPQPTITWYHDGQNITTTDQSKYIIRQTVTTEAPYTVNSTLTIMDLRSDNSGGVICFASVTPKEGEPLNMQRTSQLSVLGEKVTSKVWLSTASSCTVGSI